MIEAAPPENPERDGRGPCSGVKVAATVDGRQGYINGLRFDREDAYGPATLTFSVSASEGFVFATPADATEFVRSMGRHLDRHNIEDVRCVNVAPEAHEMEQTQYAQGMAKALSVVSQDMAHKEYVAVGGRIIEFTNTDYLGESPDIDAKRDGVLVHATKEDAIEFAGESGQVYQSSAFSTAKRNASRYVAVAGDVADRSPSAARWRVQHIVNMVDAHDRQDLWRCRVHSVVAPNGDVEAVNNAEHDELVWPNPADGSRRAGFEHIAVLYSDRLDSIIEKQQDQGLSR